MEDFVVYLTHYLGDKHPKNYIGSTSLTRLKNGYLGSPKSQEWREVYKDETRKNPHLYKTSILSIHNSREEALQYEAFWQKEHDVIKSEDFVNKAIAAPNGCFGSDVSGDKNPMYGKEKSDLNIRRTSESNKNLIIVNFKDNPKDKLFKVTVEEYFKNKEIYSRPKSEMNPIVFEKTRERVSNGTHHFCNPEVQKKIADKRRGNVFVSEEHKRRLSLLMIGKYRPWELAERVGNNNWLYCLKIYGLYIAFMSSYVGNHHFRYLINFNRFFKENSELVIGDYWLKKLTVKFKNGWNPYEDKEYLEWLENENQKH